MSNNAFHQKMCEFTVTPMPGGRFLHVCAGGVAHETKAQRYYRDCDCNLAGPTRDPAGCVHRNREERRRATCETCCGRTEIKVFACAIHGECTIQTELSGVECCAACRDYQAATKH